MTSFPAAQLLVTSALVVAMLTTIAGALIAVLTTRIIRSVCGLALCCCGLAGLYYFLQSPFLTLMEILIYIGAVCITLIFAVMLAEPDEGAPRKGSWAELGWTGASLVVSAAAFVGLAYVGLHHTWKQPAARANAGTVKDLGIALLTSYSLAFELISLVLLIAILGALVVARQGRDKAEQFLTPRFTTNEH